MVNGKILLTGVRKRNPVKGNRPVCEQEKQPQHWKVETVFHDWVKVLRPLICEKEDYEWFLGFAQEQLGIS